MKARLSPVQKMTLAAMLIVVDILGTRLPGYLQPTALFGFNRISFGPTVVIFASLALGPLWGAVVGAGADVLGWVILGTQTGPLNFFITIVYALLGVVPWLLSLLTRKFRHFAKRPWILYLLLAILWGIFVGFLFGTNVFEPTFTKWNMDVLIAKWVFFGVSLLLCVGTGIGLYASNRYFQKRILDYSSIPSPLEVALIVIIVEVFLMILLKPLAFYCNAWLYLGKSLEEAFGVSYSVLVLLSIMFSFVDIPLASFSVSWLLIFSKHFIHSYAYPVVQEEGDPEPMKEEKPRKKSELKIDESQLSEEDRQELHPKFPWGWVIFLGVLVTLIIVCMIVIFSLQ
jgi:hypothetical protein